MTVIPSRVCPGCGTILIVEATPQQRALYAQNALIQDVFPDMSSDDRERFCSGFCGPCWIEALGPEPE